MASVETGLPIWTAPDDLQEYLLGVWWENHKERQQKALESDVEAALRRR